MRSLPTRGDEDLNASRMGLKLSLSMSKESERMRYFTRLLIGMAALLITGCGLGHSGVYKAEMQLVPGKQESEKFPLEKKREEWVRYGTPKLELKSNGRYAKTEERLLSEGDWWVTDHGTIAIHCDTHNGHSIHPGLRQEIDREFNIRSSGVLFHSYGAPEANLEIVWTKQ